MAAAAGACQATEADIVVVEVGTERAASASGGGSDPQPAAASGENPGNGPEDPERAKKNEGTDGGGEGLSNKEDQSAFDAVLELLGKREDKGEPILQELRTRSSPYKR